MKSLAARLMTGFRKFLPTCQQVSRLQSDALDRSLPLLSRIGLRLHLMACRWCRRYGEQIHLLRQAAREHADDFSEASPRTLSAEARERLKHSLRNAAK